MRNRSESDFRKIKGKKPDYIIFHIEPNRKKQEVLGGMIRDSDCFIIQMDKMPNYNVHADQLEFEPLGPGEGEYYAYPHPKDLKEKWELYYDFSIAFKPWSKNITGRPDVGEMEIRASGFLLHFTRIPTISDWRCEATGEDDYFFYDIAYKDGTVGALPNPAKESDNQEGEPS